MSKTLSQVDNKIAVADIVHMGEKLILPEGMNIPQAIDLLSRRLKYEQEETAFSDSFEVFPLDGAYALQQVLTKKYGWAQAIPTPGFFGKNPPEMLRIEVAPNKFTEAPWGRFSLPNIKGYIQTGVEQKKGRWVFSLSANILRLNEREVRSLFDDVRAYLKENSIYKGQAVKIRFRDDNGNLLKMPEPSFLDTSSIDPHGLIYAKEVQDSVETNLFTPIRRVKDCLANGVPVKRGVLLGGTYGTGKTLAATVASRLAVDNGITYVYVPRADELSDAIEFAKQYQSPACVIFCEDIDRAVNGDRSVKMDDILNILDGIDTKNANIITVVTTNDLLSINPALLRPGRLDAVINVTPPDAQAVEKLIRFYAGPAIDPETNLVDAGVRLAKAKTIPAVIAEVVKRAKLSELKLLPEGALVTKLSEAAILEAANTIAAQVELLKDKEPEAITTVEQLVEQRAEVAAKRVWDANAKPLLNEIDKIVAKHV